jgi:DNA oxidative demethylase
VCGFYRWCVHKLGYKAKRTNESRALTDHIYPSLFTEDAEVHALLPDVYLLPRMADSPALLAEIAKIVEAAPFRHMSVGGGKSMSVAMTNCGDLGWTSSSAGYQYTRCDPQTGLPWPAMPAAFKQLASHCALRCGFAGFEPDACLINRYTGPAQMGLHQDKDEHDFSQPIVSVSLGASAVFLLGGNQRKGITQTILLGDADVLVWGGVARLRFHGVRSPQAGASGQVPIRFNLTFRKAG